jgi:CRP-like cAMP-binding protein
MQIDANLLLTAETLCLNPDIVSGRTVEGVSVLKCASAQTYLAVDARHLKVLNQFAQPRTVPEALGNCIRSRTCPSLREFYELILKAHRAGVLCTEQSTPARRLAVPWWGSVRLPIALLLGALAGLATVALFVVRPPSMPAHWTGWLWGWVAAGGALSLGQALAASVLHAGGGEIYQPRFRWRTVLPRFSADLGDACLGGQLLRLAVAVSLVVPLMTVTAAGLWRQAGWTAFPLAVLLLQAWPIGGTPAGRILQLCRRQPRVDADHSPLFAAPVSLRARWRKARNEFTLRAAVLQLAWGVLWALVAGQTLVRLLQLRLGSIFEDRAYWGRTALGLGAVLALTAGLWIISAILHPCRDALRNGWKRWRLTWRRWHAAGAPRLDEAAISTLIRRNLLLQRLGPDTQAEIVRQLQPFTAKAWRTIIGFGDSPAQVIFIVSGAATVCRRLKSGRRVRFLRLAEGDLFGTHQLVDPDNASLEVRTKTPLVALALGAADFERLAVAELGAAVVCNYTHKQAFLQQSALCARWRPNALARFVELADSVQFPAGSKIIEAGREVRGVFVLYEGRARALQGCKQVGRIRPGDYFGEISTLQGSAATADVEAQDDCRCLVVDRLEFIRFMVRNHHVALQVEQVCSDRLGRSIFPLDSPVQGRN